MVKDFVRLGLVDAAGRLMRLISFSGPELLPSSGADLYKC